MGNGMFEFLQEVARFLVLASVAVGFAWFFFSEGPPKGWHVVRRLRESVRESKKWVALEMLMVYGPPLAFTVYEVTVLAYDSIVPLTLKDIRIRITPVHTLTTIEDFSKSQIDDDLLLLQADEPQYFIRKLEDAEPWQAGGFQVLGTIQGLSRLFLTLKFWERRATYLPRISSVWTRKMN
ncbi:MAG TPA: hypothetical protein DIU35_07800 [Candidatus Latescibacteria bacterium]|nr:hypothetical protein [Candidatus Latescibacterota bacterium]|tara:strand:+ start:43 stop:582 length:540 start_codon:yes stop_codon:yes gene_type:complete